MGLLTWLFGTRNKTIEMPLSIANQEVSPNESKTIEDEGIESFEPLMSRHSDIKTFQPDKINIEELNKCKVGDSVNLWAPANEPTAIYIFRRSSVGGDGKIGRVPTNYASTISNYLQDGLDYEAEIIELNPAIIKYRVISKEESSAKLSIRMKEESERIQAELNKKYNPRSKTAFEIKIRLPINHHQNIGNILFLEKKPKNYYVQNAAPLIIKFLDNQGAVIAIKDNEPTLSLKILKAYFNNYSVSSKILTIYKPDKYTLPHLKDIEATALVNFEPSN